MLISDEAGGLQWAKNTGLDGDESFAPDSSASTTTISPSCQGSCNFVFGFFLAAVDMDGDQDIGAYFEGAAKTSMSFCVVLCCLVLLRRPFFSVLRTHNRASSLHLPFLRYPRPQLIPRELRLA